MSTLRHCKIYVHEETYIKSPIFIKLAGSLLFVCSVRVGSEGPNFCGSASGGERHRSVGRSLAGLIQKNCGSIKYKHKQKRVAIEMTQAI